MNSFLGRVLSLSRTCVTHVSAASMACLSVLLHTMNMNEYECLDILAD